MIEINRFGMVRKEEALKTGLRIYDFTVSENPFSEADSEASCIDLCTAAQLKLLDIYLDETEKQSVKGFVKMQGYRGLAPIYSLQEILSNRA